MILRSLTIVERSQSRARSQVRCWEHLTCERAYSGYEIVREIIIIVRDYNDAWVGGGGGGEDILQLMM
jgi:hypothetical protein